MFLVRLLCVSLCTRLCRTEFNSTKPRSLRSLGPDYSDKTTRLGSAANRNIGIELSPERTLLAATAGGFGPTPQFTGAVSLFAVDRHAEVAFPFFVCLGSTEGIPSRILNIDATYRRFVGGFQGGLYFSGGVRYGYASGVELVDRDPTGRKIVHTKFGFYAGIGYRYFSHSGFYWGTSLVVGRFLGDFSHRAASADQDDGSFLIDSEILKIGYAS